MSTLHDLLEAAIKERLAVAQAAHAKAAGIWPWMTPADNMPVTRFIVANGPDRIIRDCESDLRLLEWLTKAVIVTTADGYNLDPITPLLDLAEAYGIEAPSTSEADHGR
jgi:hypothetical protein